MKKKIAILGSTGSIGKMTFDLIDKDKKNFDIELLSTNKNVSDLIKQAKKFNVKNLIINDYKSYINAKKKYSKLDINFYNSFTIIDKIFKKKKIFYSMVSLVGLDGLRPTLQLIKFTQNIAIANKESLICGWNLIKKNLLFYKTNFIPVDSEHFSIFSLLKNHNKNLIDKIFITASGGPFLNYSKLDLLKVNLNEALNHPNWKMGKKITIDSSTMMNKVFEVIEAKNIFEVSYDQIQILTHPSSYVHAIVKFNNGIIKILLHDTDMKIPIHNSIYQDNFKKIYSKPLNLNILNNLRFKKIDIKKFPVVKLIQSLPKKNSLYETALISINDYLVSKYLKKKITYTKLVKLINFHANHKNFTKFRKSNAKNVDEIYKIRDYVNLKLDTLGI